MRSTVAETADHPYGAPSATWVAKAGRNIIQRFVFELPMHDCGPKTLKVEQNQVEAATFICHSGNQGPYSKRISLRIITRTLDTHESITNLKSLRTHPHTSHSHQITTHTLFTHTHQITTHTHTLHEHLAIPPVHHTHFSRTHSHLHQITTHTHTHTHTFHLHTLHSHQVTAHTHTHFWHWKHLGTQRPIQTWRTILPSWCQRPGWRLGLCCYSRSCGSGSDIGSPCWWSPTKTPTWQDF
jgi:hypothetical protein